MNSTHHYEQLIEIFNSCFADEFNTRLIKGDFEPDRVVFQRRVHAQVMDYLANGIPERPARFIKALQNYYHTPELTAEQFPWPEALN